jgi:hypothetical protein
MDYLLVLPVLLVVAVIAIAIIGYRQVAKKKARLAHALDELGFQPSPKRRFLTLREGVDGTVSDQGRSFRVRLCYASRNSPGSIRLGLAVDHGCGFRALRRRRLARFLGAGLRTSDGAFDALCRVTTDDEEEAAACLARAEVRAALTILFESGCSRVEARNGELSAEWKPFNVLDRSPVATLRRGMGDLSGLAAALPRSWPLGPDTRARRFLTQRRFETLAVAAWVVLGAAILGLALLDTGRFPLDPWPLFRRSLRISLPALVLAGLAAHLALGRRTWYADAALRLAPLVLALPVLGWFGAVQANVRFDSSPAVPHATVAVGRYRVTGKHTRHHVVVQSWRAGHGLEDLEVPRSLYDSLKHRGWPITVTTRQGALGSEWVTAVEASGGS